jgi:GTP 3',8-cyclase
VTFRIEAGRIQASACEINATHHCNLACRACSHLSPILPRKHADPDRVYRDLSLLARSYHAAHVRIVGGEPLLHPRLPNLIEAVRASQVTDRIRVLTNGVRLAEADQAFWELVDEVHVSVYPQVELSGAQISTCNAIAERNAVDLVWKKYHSFRESYAELPSDDPALVSRIYTSCQIAHVWHCHTIDDGYFYKCPQSAFIPAVVCSDQKITTAGRDGIEISATPTFMNDLREYLETSVPLRSCSYCLASVGKRFSHDQVQRRLWRTPQLATVETLVDMEQLNCVEEDPGADNLCADATSDL